MFPSFFFFPLTAFFCLSFSSLPLLFDILKPKKVPTRWGLWHIYIYIFFSDSRESSRLILANRFRVPELNPLFCESRFGGPKRVNCRFEAIRANRSHVMKTGFFFCESIRANRPHSCCESPGHLSFAPAQHINFGHSQVPLKCQISLGTPNPTISGSEKGSFQKSPFSRGSRDSRELPDCGKQRGIRPFSNLEILEI